MAVSVRSNMALQISKLLTMDNASEIKPGFKNCVWSKSIVIMINLIPDKEESD